MRNGRLTKDKYGEDVAGSEEAYTELAHNVQLIRGHKGRH